MDKKILLDDHRGQLIYYPQVFSPDYFEQFDQGIAWQQDAIKIFGRIVPLPRQTAWYGDSGVTYKYSGIVNHPKPWTPLLLEIKSRVEELSGALFNSVLLNRYAHGKDYQGYHADDEPELGDRPLIASVSFGATRIFRLKEKRGEKRIGIQLEPGSVLIMAGALQTFFVHGLPKATKVIEPRINLTFRRIVTTIPSRVSVRSI
jgi:alkylated DNA repair dioxygenase AlkB